MTSLMATDLRTDPDSIRIEMGIETKMGISENMYSDRFGEGHIA